MAFASSYRWPGAGLALVLAASPALAGVFGVPTNVSTTTGAVCTGLGLPDAGCTAASGNPPGWLVLNNSNFTAPASASGDVVHQVRFFVEVTGTTLDIKVFDPYTGPASAPATSGARDFNALNPPATTRYRLLAPSGQILNLNGGAAEGGPLAGTSDTVAGVITENRLVRFGCVNGAAPAFAATNGGVVFGAGAGGCAALTPGLYVFEAAISVNPAAGASANAFGVQFTDAAGAHYNAYTIGSADDATTLPANADTSLIVGRVNQAGSTGLVTEPVTFFPFVDRGCTFQATNFDAGADVATEGANGAASTTAPEGGVSSLLLGASDDHLETTVTAEPPSGVNYSSTNYGMFPVSHTLGGTTENNWVDWRFADSIPFGTGNPGNLPNYPLVPVKMYLPNGYTGCNGTAGSCTFTAPVEPTFSVSAVVTSGPNPPVVGSATIYTLTATVHNPTTTALANVRITSPLTTGETFVAASQQSFVDGVAAPCTDASTANARICTFAALAAGSTASLQYQVTVTPASVGLVQLTGVPPSALFAVTGIALAGTTATATTAGNHGYAIGDRVLVTGANQDGFNGVVTLTAVTATTFGYTVPTGTTGPATTARTMYATERCSDALNAPACATFEPAWRSTPGSPQLVSAGPACDLRTLAIGSPVDLALTKADAPDPVSLGSTITYTIGISNLNPPGNAAPNAQFADALPAGTSFVSLAGTAGWTCTTPQVGENGNVICTIGSLPVGNPVSTFTLTVRVDDVTGTVTNTASVSSAGQEQNPADNTASATTTVAPGADLRIAKSGTPNAQPAGANVSFVLLVANLGPSPANAPVVTDVLPGAGPWRFQSVTAPGYTCTTPAVNATGTVTCTRNANLPAGTVENLTLVLSIAAGTPVGPITNSATIASGTADPVAANNTSTDTTQVVTTCSPTANGTLTTGVVNSYFPGTATAAAGATSITLGAKLAGSAAQNITAGDLLLVIQMQDGTFNSSDTDAYGDGTAGDMPSLASPGQRAPALAASGSLLTGNAGRYEYVVAANAVGAGGGALNLAAPLLNTYTNAAPAFNAAGSNGQRTFQVVRVPIYANLALTGNVTALAWSGTTEDNSGGGVLALDVTGTLTLAGFGFDASARGFRGGRGLGVGNDNATATVHIFRNNNTQAANQNEAMKGEGINGSSNQTGNTNQALRATAGLQNGSGYPGAAANDGNASLGAPGNAGGGGAFDSAGGGGANGGSGGGGGDEYCTAPGCQPGDLSSVAHPVGWTGGRGGLLSFTPTLGRVVMGGGGGGGADHNNDSGHGGVGGGLILVRAGTIAGAGTVNANGETAPNPSGTGNAGGGGAGGSIVFSENGAGAIPATVTITANGGNGGNASDHAPGGGAGGGVIVSPPGSLAARSVTAGNNGFRSTTQPIGNTNAEPGKDGLLLTLVSAPTPAEVGACGPVVDVGVTIVAPPTTSAGSNLSYAIAVANGGPSPAPNATLAIPVPPRSTFVSISAPLGWTCTTPPVGGSGTITCVRTAGDLPAFSAESFTLVTNVDPGTPAGTLIPATADAATSAQDANLANNQATTNTVIQQAAAAALTRASIRGFAADPASGLVAFVTGTQRGTASFNVYAVRDPNDTREREQLNAAPIAAPQPNSVAPVLYEVHGRPFAAPYVLVEEVETSGRAREMGPFAVGDPRLAASLRRVETRLLKAGAAQVDRTGVRVRALPARGSERLARQLQKHRGTLRAERQKARARRKGSEGLKLLVEGGGPVFAKRADLVAQGLPAWVPTGSLRLHNLGARVPFQVLGEGADEAILFDAGPLETTYTRKNAYVLTWAGKPPQAPSVKLSSEADPPRAGFTRVERSAVYLANAPQGSDPWLWDLLVGDGTPWPYAYDPGAGSFDLPGLIGAGTARIRLKVAGYSPLRHRVRAWVNGAGVGSVEFDGARTAALDGVLDAGTLLPAGNRLEIRYEALDPTADDPGYVYLDYVELEVGAAPREPRALDASRIEPYDASLPADAARADYLIVTSAELEDQAQRLAGLKRALGRRVAVVDVERAYDRFSGGLAEAAAVRALVEHSFRGGRLRDVVLLGDDTFDYRGFLGEAAFPVLPSLQGWDGEFGRVPSENLYADVDGDGAPDVAIGRLPAQTSAEADAIVSKIERQQATLASQRGRHLLVVDNQAQGDPSFRAAASDVAYRFLRGTLAWSELSAGVSAARAQLLSGLASAPALTHYFGHGGPQIWADEQLLAVDDTAPLRALPESVYLQWACESQFYPYLFGDSLGEALLLLPTGGALASFGPAGITDPEQQATLYDALYAELANPGLTLGEAIRRAKAHALLAAPQARAAVAGFNLLGDPSLRLGGLGPGR